MGEPLAANANTLALYNSLFSPINCIFPFFAFLFLPVAAQTIPLISLGFYSRLFSLSGFPSFFPLALPIYLNQLQRFIATAPSESCDECPVNLGFWSINRV